MDPSTGKHIHHQAVVKYKLRLNIHLFSDVACVANKVQSRFLVKQEVGFYLSCTEQLLETDAKQH